MDNDVLFRSGDWRSECEDDSSIVTCLMGAEWWRLGSKELHIDEVSIVCSGLEDR